MARCAGEHATNEKVNQETWMNMENHSKEQWSILISEFTFKIGTCVKVRLSKDYTEDTWNNRGNENAEYILNKANKSPINTTSSRKEKSQRSWEKLLDIRNEPLSFSLENKQNSSKSRNIKLDLEQIQHALVSWFHQLCFAWWNSR